MRMEFININLKNKHKSIRFISLCVLFTVAQHVYAIEEPQWQAVPETNYADVLDLIALRAKANYDEISTWKGQMNILDTFHHYGTDVVKRLRMIDKSSLSGDTKHICEIAKSTADFSIDMRNDELYCSVEPNVQFKAVDLNQYISFAEGVHVKKAITILEPKAWIHYEPEGRYWSKSNKGQPEKMAFIDTVEDIKGLNGSIRDPRVFFNSGGENKKLWETLLEIKSSINESIKERISGLHHIEITSLDTDNGVKYHILTTWRGGDKYTMKYIQVLLEVDEAIGFNATQVEITNPEGIKLALQKYIYENFDGIYVPKIIREEFLNSKSEITSTSEITIETTGLNEPLPEDTFTIKNLGLENGTLVTDKITDTEFRYSKGALVPVAEPNNPPN